MEPTLIGKETHHDKSRRQVAAESVAGFLRNTQDGHGEVFIGEKGCFRMKTNLKRESHEDTHSGG
jgi:hypothetical protein